MHFIQRHILDCLVNKETLRNRDMRPERVESNHFQYHLKRLIAEGYVEKTEAGYRLASRGLMYADRHSTALRSQRSQPKLITLLYLTDERGRVLLIPRSKQPFIGTYNLPSGKIHLGETLKEAAERELHEKAHLHGIELTHCGSVHLTVSQGETIISEYYGFVLKGSLPATGKLRHGRLYEKALSNTALMPGVAVILDFFATREGFFETNVEI